MLKVDDVSVEDDFFELGGHSLLLTPLMQSIWKNFGVRLGMRQFFMNPTVRGVASLLVELREGRARMPSTETYDQGSSRVQKRFDFLYEEAKLADDIRPEKPFVYSRPRTILMTGATGYVGAFVLAELLEQSKAEVLGVIRCDSPEHGKKRIEDNLRRFGLWKDEYRSRIHGVPGNLTKAQLGMDDRTYADVAERADMIVHNGAAVNFIYPYDALRQANVEGTREVIRLACKQKTKPVHYSRASRCSRWGRTGGSPRRTASIIASISTWGTTRRSGSRRSCSAMRVSAASRRSSIGRGKSPGQQDRAHRSGTLPLRGRVGLARPRCDPGHELFVDLAPVDFVAKSMVYIGLREDSLGKTFHLTNVAPIHSSRAFDWLRNFGYEFEFLPFHEWRDRLMKSDDFRSNPLYPFAAVLDDFHPTTSKRRNTIGRRRKRPSREAGSRASGRRRALANVHRLLHPRRELAGAETAHGRHDRMSSAARSSSRQSP